jgi:hypothetical protein
MERKRGEKKREGINNHRVKKKKKRKKKIECLAD